MTFLKAEGSRLDTMTLSSTRWP